MSSHGIKQTTIILSLAFILCLIFGIMSLVNPFWIGYAFLTITCSALVSWFVAILFEIIIEAMFGIRFNIRGETTLNYKYTTNWFGLSFAFVQFIIIASVAFLIDQNLSEALIPFAEKYRDGIASEVLGWMSIIVALIILFGGLFSEYSE